MEEVVDDEMFLNLAERFTSASGQVFPFFLLHALVPSRGHSVFDSSIVQSCTSLSLTISRFSPLSLPLAVNR